MSIELWKTIFDWGAVVLVGFTLITGAGALITGRIINDRQSAQLQKIRTDLTANQTELAKQQERAAKADAQVAGLQKAASDAQSAQQRVATELETQRERAAKAEAVLLRLENRQGNRYVKNHSVSKGLKGKSTGTVIIWYQPNDPEAYWFANSISGELLAANWNIPIPVPIPDNISSVAFLGPEYQTFSAAVEKLDRTIPPATRIAGGNGELTLLSKAFNESDPNNLATILTNALRPLVFANWGWRPAPTLPDNTFILIVGPKP
jgi:hypothetical protein